MCANQAYLGAGRIAAAAAVLIALAAPVHAQQKPSSGELALAREIVAIKGAENLFTPLIPGVIEQAKFLFLRQNPNLQKDLEDVSAALREEFKPRMAEIVTELSKIYARHFNESEMKEMLVFYKSPLGKKVLATEPVIADQGLKFAQEWSTRLSDEVIKKMRVEMKKRGHDI